MVDATTGPPMTAGTSVELRDPALLLPAGTVGDAVADGDVQPVRVEGPSAWPELSADGAQGVTERIRRATVTALDALADIDDAIRQAYEGRAWIALGYDTWEAYCSTEFAHTRMWSTVEERHARTSALREGGLSVRAIAAVLGVAKSTADRDVAASLSTVPGGTVDTSRSTGRDGRSLPSQRGSSADVLTRRVEVARMRAQGMSQVEVADRLGVSQPTVSADEGALAEATQSLAEDARSRIDGMIHGEVPLDVVGLAGDLGVVLAPATAPGSLLLSSARAIVRDLTATAAYLRDGVVYSDLWVQDERASEDASAVLLLPLSAVLRDLAQALTRIEMAGVPAGDLERARAHVAQATSWMATWSRR